MNCRGLAICLTAVLAGTPTGIAGQELQALPDTLSIAQAVRVAFDNNPELAIADARVDAAAAGQRADP